MERHRWGEPAEALVPDLPQTLQEQVAGDRSAACFGEDLRDRGLQQPARGELGDRVLVDGGARREPLVGGLERLAAGGVGGEEGRIRGTEERAELADVRV